MSVIKLIDALNIVKTAPRQEAQALNVYLVCGYTPLHMQTFLTAHLQLRSPDRSVQVQTGLYGDIAGNLERAAEAGRDAVALVLEWPDFDPRLGIRAAVSRTPSLEELQDSISRKAQLIQHVIETRLPNTTIAVSLPTIAARTDVAQPCWLTTGLETMLTRCIADFKTWALGHKSVRVLSSQRLDALSPSNIRSDVRSEMTAGFPYQLHHASVVADLLSRLIRPPLAKKGLITDLDDTLWSGIVGEVGVEGISWSLERNSHTHALYQQQLRTLAGAGAFVAVASKNDPDVVQQAFRRSDLLLDANQMFPVEVSWGPKSEAVRRILQAWNVGSDSVVFVDDSPMELGEVQSAFPEIECLPFPKNDPQACIELFDQLRDLFGKNAISVEDTLRVESVRTPAVLTKEFLEDSEAEITFSDIKDPSDSRPLELINKTNQFNLNGRRFTETEWRVYLADPATRLLVASYKDKYGQLGRVSVVGSRADGDRVSVDFWVMSCRAFSRRIEHQCLRRLFSTTGAGEIHFDFAPTQRNGPLQEFFRGLLDRAPQGRFALSGGAFERKCPQLFHTVKELL